MAAARRACERRLAGSHRAARVETGYSPPPMGCLAGWCAREEVLRECTLRNAQRRQSHGSVCNRRLLSVAPSQPSPSLAHVLVSSSFPPSTPGPVVADNKSQSCARRSSSSFDFCKCLLTCSNRETLLWRCVSVVFLFLSLEFPLASSSATCNAVIVQEDLLAKTAVQPESHG